MDPARQEKDFDWTECDIFLAQLQLTLFVVYLGLKNSGRKEPSYRLREIAVTLGSVEMGNATLFPLPSSHDIKSDLQRRESRKFLARVDKDKSLFRAFEMRDIVSRGWGTKRANFLAELLFKWPFSAPLTKRTGPCEIAENLLWAGLKGHFRLSAKF